MVLLGSEEFYEDVNNRVKISPKNEKNPKHRKFKAY